MSNYKDLPAQHVTRISLKAFVLSWSLLEVMASGTPVLAEANQMMEELIEPGGMVRSGTVIQPAWLGSYQICSATLEQLQQWGKDKRATKTHIYAGALLGFTGTDSARSSSPFLTQHQLLVAQ